MKNNLKRISCALLAAMTLALAACSSDSNVDDGNVTSDTSVSENVETVQGDTQPKLAFGAENNKGRDFKILTTTHATYEYAIEEETGEIVADAVYARNQAVEELLGINLKFKVENGHWADRETFNSLVRNSVMANDGAYDLVNGVTVCVIPIASEGIFLNAADLEYVDLDNPWWVQGMMDNLAINGKLFGFIGDASLSLYKDLSVVYFNKTMLDNYGMDDPYAMVTDGSWTIDKLFGMSEEVASDLDGDGVMNKDNDLFGYIAHFVPQRAFLTATEMELFEFDDDGLPYLASLSEHTVTIYEKLYNYLSNRDVIYAVDVTDHKEVSVIFEGSRALFMLDFLYDTEYLREMSDEFGIVPVPKASEAQDDYHTQIGTSTSMFFVPKTTPNAELTSKVCEALSFYSSNDVVPKYYEVALKEKYTRDETVKEMLNIIRDSAQMDFTFAYSTIFAEFPPNNITEVRPAHTINDNLTSFFASKSTVWQGNIDELIESYSEIE